MTKADDVERRYLLGLAEEDERESLERSYFADAAVLERVDAAEEGLIEAYLAGELGSDERSRFEREYLASPTRRRRVDTVRWLMQAAERQASTISRTRWTGAYLPLAASLLIAVMAGWWFLASRPPDLKVGPATAAAPASAQRAPGAPASAPPAPQVVALALSPISTRSAGETPTVTVPPGTDTVRLDLHGDGTRGPLPHPRAIVQTVSGRDVWQGDAEQAPGAPALAARVNVPASRLAADDYVVILLVAEQERYRYFFRVRIP